MLISDASRIARRLTPMADLDWNQGFLIGEEACGLDTSKNG